MKLRTATLFLSTALAIGLVVPAQAADPAAGKAKAQMTCAGCHGQQGEGSGDNPAIAGMDAETIATVTMEFKSGKRENPAKQALLGMVTEEDIANIAAYYAGL